MFSKACEYAMRAAVYIAKCSMEGKRVAVKEVAEATDIPEAFASKVLQRLARAGLVDSLRGKKGGFSMSASQQKRSLYEIVTLFEGEAYFNSCVLGLPVCSSQNPCPLHYQVVGLRDALKKSLQQTTIRKAATEVVDAGARLRFSSNDDKSH